MTWSTLRQRAQQLGFELSYRTRAASGGGYLPEMATPPETSGLWLCVGNYEHVAGLWLSPVTAEARGLPRERVAMLLEDCDPFVETVGDYDAEFFAACRPGRAAADHPECGKMPS
jgi:hypothetical protein